MSLRNEKDMLCNLALHLRLSAVVLSMRSRLLRPGSVLQLTVQDLEWRF